MFHKDNYLNENTFLRSEISFKNKKISVEVTKLGKLRQVSVLRKTSDDVDDAVLVFLLLTLNIFQTFFYCFYC